MQPHQRNRTSHTAAPQASRNKGGASDRDGVPERQRGAVSGRHESGTHPARRVSASVLTASRQGARASSHNSSETAGSKAETQLAPLRLLVPALTLLLLVGAATLLYAQNHAELSPMPSGMTLDKNEAPPQFDPVKLAVAFVLICVNAFFSLAEYALITVRKTRIRQLAEEGNRSAQMVEYLLSHPTRLMATIQTGVTVIATLSSALAANSAVGPLAYWIHTHSRGFVAAYASVIALLAVTLPVAVVALVIGEVAPKSLAVRSPERFALRVVHPIRWLQAVLTPVVSLLTLLSNLVVRPFGGTVSFTIPAVNKEELEILVEQSVEQGVVDEAEKNMISGVLDFGETVARRVMTPRIDLTTFEASGEMPDLICLVAQSGHSRIPIYEGDLDNIVGIVHAKDLLQLPGDASRDVVPIRSVMRAPYFIPETKKVSDLLAEFRRSKQQLAIVRDEYGVTSGLVTIEDVLEEIVGDIQDEYDMEEPQVQVLDATTSILDGKMSLDDVNERMGLELPEDEADTIGGFVFGLLGHQAEQGERAQWENIAFIVETTDGRRITKVRLIRLPDAGRHETEAVEQAYHEASARSAEATQNRRALEISGVETAPRPRLRHSPQNQP